MHLIIIKSFKLSLLVLDIHLVGTGVLGIEISLVVHVIVLKILFYQVVVLLCVGHI